MKMKKKEETSSNKKKINLRFRCSVDIIDCEGQSEKTFSKVELSQSIIVCVRESERTSEEERVCVRMCLSACLSAPISGACFAECHIFHRRR